MAATPSLSGREVPRWVLSDAAETRIAAREGDGPEVLSWAYSARLLGDGAVAIHERRIGEIRIFDREGRFVTQLGGRGDGPGEFSRETLLELLPGDTLLVWDEPRRRLTTLVPDGSVLATETIVLPWIDQPSRVEAVLPDRSLLVSVSRMPEFRREPGTVTNWGFGLTRRHPGDTESLDTLASVDAWSVYTVGPAATRLVPFAREALFAFRGPHVYLAMNDSFSFLVFDAVRGEPEQLVRVEEEPERASEEHLERYWEHELAASADAEQRAQIRGIRGEIPAGPTVPIIEEIEVSFEGNVWVQRGALPGADERIWEVFSPEGRHLARVEVPADLAILHVRGDRVAFRQTDELGVPEVRVHRLDRGNPTGRGH